MGSGTRKIIHSIFIAKGICILLVVGGHYRPSTEPAYWVDFYTIRHQFTMPLFFLLSGFLFRYVSSSGDENYFKVFFQKKIPRLAYPYLSISLLLFLAKYVTGKLFHLQHPASLQTIVNVFVNPLAGHATMLWFIYTLTLVFIVYPLLLMILRSDWLVFAATIGMVYLPATEYFCIRPLLHHLPFFVAGILLVGRVDFDELSPIRSVVAVVACGAVFTVFYLVRDSFDIAAGRVILGLSGSFAVIALSSLLTRPAGNVVGRALEKTGFYSMSIYLLHTFILGFARILKHQVLRIDDYFAVGAFIAIVAATVIPLFLEKAVLRKLSPTRKFILGLKPAEAPRRA